MLSPPADILDPRRQAVARLTPKERECLERWLHHATAKEIAIELGISHHAVEKRLKSARAKLGVTTTLEAARLLAATEGYGRTASQSSEGTERSAVAKDGFADSSTGFARWHRQRNIFMGVMIMSLVLAGAIAFTLSQPAADASSPEVMVIDRDASKAAEQIAAAAEKSFTRLDKDGSGFIERAEWPAIKVRTIRVGADDAPQQKTAPDVAAADANGDGRISRTEYRAWMSNWAARSRS